MKLKKILGLGLVSVAAFGLVACGSSSSDASSEDTNTLKVGIVTLDETSEPVWDKVSELAEEEGVTLDLVEFADYTQLNSALDNGELDVNAFQHYNFLNNWNEENSADLVAVGETYLSPISLYSGLDSDGNALYTDVEDIEEGSTITIPNDATNGSRALYVLQSAGLIELGVEDGADATVNDITSNPKNIEILEVDAAQTAANLTSVAASVINNDYVVSAGVSRDTILFTEEVNAASEQWINIIAAQSDWEESDKADAIKTLVASYQTDEVAQIIYEASDGATFGAWEGAPDVSTFAE